MGYWIQLSLELDAVFLPYLPLVSRGQTAFSPHDAYRLDIIAVWPRETNLPSGRRTYGAQQGFGEFMIIKFEVDNFKLYLG